VSALTTGTPAPPAPVVGNPHLAGVFAPVSAEVDATDLEVIGELPAALDGAYLRNGPNPRFSPIGHYVYPLDGDGMVHRVVLREGRAAYTNRFVRTPAVRAEEIAGRALWAGLTDPYVPDADLVGPELAGTTRPLPDINVVRHGGRLLALAESDVPFRLDRDLGTVGPETFDGSQPAGVTAHPKIDPRTGEMVVFCYGLQEPFLTWSTIRPDGTGTSPTPVPGLDRPVMIHDMALTARHVVLVVAPMFFDLAAALTGGSMLSWEPDGGTRIALVPRDGGPVRWIQDDAFWMWHAAGAYERPDGVVVLDYVQWDAPAGLAPGEPAGHGAFARAIIDETAGTVRRTVLDDRAVEFPRIDDRSLTGHHHTVATAGSTGRRPAAEGPSGPDALTWFDPDAGTSVTWESGDLAVGEPCYAPEPGRTGPDTGWWLTFATERSTGHSWLLVFPAADPASGPQARVRMPVRVPLGLHGAWLPTEE